MAELKILWQNTTKTTVDTKEIEQHLLEVLRRLKTVGRVEIEISIVDDKEIKTLKQRFFGINEPTDVLSFPYDGEVKGLTGSLAISVETATKQAAEAGIELIDELKTLSSHGLLHLLGYHHR
ncbi:MAG: rRNA maturation RNase YbeY [Patescibacteria group bacterium]